MKEGVSPEGQAHGVEAGQLRAVDHGCKVSLLRVAPAPQAAHERCAVLKTVPCERLHTQAISIATRCM